MGPVRGPGWLKPPARAQGLLQDSWEKDRLGCVRGQVLVWTRGPSIGGISQKEKENRGTQQPFREFSAAAVASCAPIPHSLDGERGISSLSTHLKPGWLPRSVDWAPTVETPGGPTP